MKSVLLIVLSLAAIASAGPAGKQAHMNSAASNYDADLKSTQATEILKHWCYSSQMSQSELTSSFKKLINAVKSSPEDSTTETAVMSERICQDASNTQVKSPSSADAQAHELIKDVYMDSLIACDSRECMKQLVKIINSNKVDTIRASYYMTRIAVTESDEINDDRDVQELADSYVANPSSSSDAIERQKLFAVTALIGKTLKSKSEQQQQQQQSSELKQTADKVIKTIVDRYINQVSSQEVAQYQQQTPQQQSSTVANKIAKRNAALKALANIPGYIIKETSSDVEQILMKIAQDKEEMVTARQSAIECLEQDESALQTLKQITFDQDEPIEVRVAALRASMTTLYAGKKDDSSKQQQASQLVDQVVKHCEDQRNQDSDDQFVLYAVSFLDNMRTSQQPEHDAIKQVIAKNKQHFMQIQLLNKKFKQQLSDVRKSSRNYKLEQEFNQIESGLVIEGDLVYDSKKSSNQYNAKSSATGAQILPKVVRFNMSMPVMGKTVNVVEVTVRQNQMDDELLGALKLVQGAKFNSDSMSKVVDSFKSSVDQSRKNSYNSNSNKQSAEADLSIKVDGCTVIYVSVDDFKSSSSSSYSHQRNTRSAYSIIDEVIEHLKRKPVAFNRGFNFNINERLAKVLDVDANIIAGLRFMSRASGSSSKDFEIVANVEPRFAFEAIVGPAKMSSKKLLQRVSTKTALGLRLRYKSNELVDVQVDLPLENMELFTVETQMVEKNNKYPSSYAYLPESIYGQEDIHSVDEMWNKQKMLDTDDLDNYGDRSTSYSRNYRNIRSAVFSKRSSLANLMSGKSSFAHSFETSEQVARATGLRGKLRMVASPKDLTFLVQAFAQKYEPSMQGYRVQVQKAGRQADQFNVILSTPGSRYDRTISARVAMKQSASRAYFKTELQSPNMAALAQYELIYDGHQYAVKAEIASTRGKQWRHALEAGVVTSSQSPAGRIATAYKPFLSIQSSSLKRPVQMQGVVSYQQSPKTVISYELKCPTTGDFVQGKFIADFRTPAYLSKRSLRSMQSPIELVLNNDITLTGEFVAQVEKYALKAHQMIDWDSSKYSVNADYAASYKNLRKSDDSQVLAKLQLDADQQSMSVERKSVQDNRKNFRFVVKSDCKSSTAHQMDLELIYNGKRVSNAVVAYKHKLQFNKSSKSKIDFAYDIELIASEHHINEKLNGRSLIALDRNMKTVRADLNTRAGQAKVELEFVSLSKHNLQVVYQGAQWRHETTVLADNHLFSMRCRTDKRGQVYGKMVLEVLKQQNECQLLLELPNKHTQVAADLKLASGKTSSWAVQTPRFSSKAEFSFDKMSRSSLFSNRRNIPSWMKPIAAFNPISSLRFKSDLKDTLNQEGYWVDSNWNGQSDSDKSYLRLDSPVYRTDIEYDPRSYSTKLGAFARPKRSADSYNSLYSSSNSVLSQALDRNLNLGSNLWMLRSIVDLPLQKQARRVLFDYADKRQQHKHSFDYNPTSDRVLFNWNRQPSTEYSSSSPSYVSPMRFTGDLSTATTPSSLSLSSDYLDFDFTAKPFDGEDSYATLTALSRHRRSPFKKHESEFRYKKNAGYTASMKHQDAKDRRHSWQMEADESPKKWAKMSYDLKDSPNQATYGIDSNWNTKSDDAKSYLRFYSPQYRSDIEYDPRSYSTRFGAYARSKRSADSYNSLDSSSNSALSQALDRNLNLGSNLWMIRSIVDLPLQKQARRVLFDYADKRQQHKHSFDYNPTSKRVLFSLNRQPSTEYPSSSYVSPMRFTGDLSTATTPSSLSLSSDYIDVDFAAKPFDGEDSYATLTALSRHRRSPFKKHESEFRYKKNAGYTASMKHHDADDRLHSLQFDADDHSPKKYGKMSYDNEKYGPITIQVDSDSESAIVKVDSPVLSGKLIAETSSHDVQRVKIELDNKSQRVQMTKVIRNNVPALRDVEFVQKLAQKLDNGRFEHETEIVASIVKSIFKLKSQTKMNGHHVLEVDGEYNSGANKAFAKINGERTKGQVVVNLVSKSANLVLDVDDKRTLQHQTRVFLTNGKHYTVESMTSYKQRPLFKLSGEICSMIFSDPDHLFATRRSSSRLSSSSEHISTFEATIFEPKPLKMEAIYNCLVKEAVINVKDQQKNSVSRVQVNYDDKYDQIHLSASTTGPHGISKHMSKTIDMASFVKAY